MTPDLPALLADPELSPGPWYWEPRSRLLPTRIGVEGHRRGVGDYMVAAFIDDSQRPEPGNANADARFIAAARNEVPALLAEVERLREALTDLSGRAPFACCNRQARGNHHHGCLTAIALGLPRKPCEHPEHAALTPPSQAVR